METEIVYRKVRASYVDAKDRFYRILLVREDLDPAQIGMVLLSALGSQFEHMMIYKTRNRTYVPDTEDMPIDTVPMSQCTMEELEEGFHLVYDLGDYWEFDCKVYKRTVTRDDDRIAILMEGKGQGIWEDEHYTLDSYLDGRIGPEIRPGDPDSGFSSPWNYEIEEYSDFDTCYDIDEEQERLDEELPDLIGEEDGGDTIGEAVMHGMLYQVEEVPEVRREFLRLSRKNGPDEAMKMIYEALADEFMALLTMKGPCGRDHYLARLKKLK